MIRPVHDETSLTQTLVTRLQSFHAALRAVRQRFDDAPDTGLIGKSIKRFFLRTYLAVKGTVGTLFILTFMTVGTALATTLNLSVLVLSPVLATSTMLATALFNLVIYDTACAAARRRVSCSVDKMPSCVSPLLKICIGVPYFVILPGTIQSVMAATRLVVHPIIGTVVLSWATIRFVVRTLRDSFTWVFIRRYSRIPASDTFLAWRVHGPGLAQVEYYRLPLEAAKAGALLLLDKYRLHAHAQVRRRELDTPYDCYSELFGHLMQSLGVNTSLQVPHPSSLASRAVWEIQSEKTRAPISNDTAVIPRTAEHPLDIWDAVAEGIRSSHPDFAVEQDQRIMNRWAGSDIMSGEISDVGIIEAVDVEFMKEQSLRETELGEVVLRAGKLLAEWNMKMSERDHRLTWAVSIPPSARGRFRMSEVELQEVWEFTLEAVELYGQQIKEELKEVLETSEFSAEIHDTVIRATDSFYSHSGARPGRDIPVVAAFLLKELLGDFDMLETLEATDEKLVLSPKMSKEDEHLIFWRSVSSTTENYQPWVLMP